MFKRVSHAWYSRPFIPDAFSHRGYKREVDVSKHPKMLVAITAHRTPQRSIRNMPSLRLCPFLDHTCPCWHIFDRTYPPLPHNNALLSQGSEGVDIKEGSYGNLVYRNTIRGQMDPETGGELLPSLFSPRRGFFSCLVSRLFFPPFFPRRHLSLRCCPLQAFSLSGRSVGKRLFSFCHFCLIPATAWWILIFRGHQHHHPAGFVLIFSRSLRAGKVGGVPRVGLFVTLLS